MARAGSRPLRWLNAEPLVYLGTISYTVYLSHHVILLGSGQALAAARAGLARTVLAIAVTLAVAEPMRRWVEAALRRLRKRLPCSRRAGGERAARSPLPAVRTS